MNPLVSSEREAFCPATRMAKDRTGEIRLWRGVAAAATLERVVGGMCRDGPVLLAGEISVGVGDSSGCLALPGQEPRVD